MIQLGSKDHLNDSEFARRLAELAIRKAVPIALRAAASVQKDAKHKAALLEHAGFASEKVRGSVALEAKKAAAYAAAAAAAYAADAASAASDAYAAYAAAAAAAYAADADAAAYAAADAAAAAAYAPPPPTPPPPPPLYVARRRPRNLRRAIRYSQISRKMSSNSLWR